MADSSDPLAAGDVADRDLTFGRRLRWHGGFALAIAVAVWAAWFGANVSCTNEHSCTAECRPCRHIAQLAIASWVAVLALLVVVMVTRRRPSSGFAALYVLLGVGLWFAISWSG